MSIPEMRILYLFNRVRRGSKEVIERGENHDGHFFGMYRLPDYGIKAEYLEIEQFFYPAVCRFLRRHVLNMHFVHVPLFLKFFKYDIVFTSTAFGSLFLWALWPFKKPRWVIFDFNILGTIGSKKSFKQKILAYSVSRCSGVITICKDGEKAMRKAFPQIEKHTEFIPLGVDIKYFVPRTDIKEENTILSVGRDLGRDIKTLLSVAESLPNLTFKLTTKKSVIKKYEPLPKNVQVCDFTPIQLKEEYAKASMVVISLDINKKNPYDTMGCSSLVESMAMGKAIVATRTATMESCIESNINGILVWPSNPNKMKEAIEFLLNNPEERRHMGSEARRFIEKNCSAEKFAENLASYFKKLVQK